MISKSPDCAVIGALISFKLVEVTAKWTCSISSLDNFSLDQVLLSCSRWKAQGRSAGMSFVSFVIISTSSRWDPVVLPFSLELLSKFVSECKRNGTDLSLSKQHRGGFLRALLHRALHSLLGSNRQRNHPWNDTSDHKGAHLPCSAASCRLPKCRNDWSRRTRSRRHQSIKY